MSQTLSLALVGVSRAAEPDFFAQRFVEILRALVATSLRQILSSFFVASYYLFCFVTTQAEFGFHLFPCFA